MDWKLFAATFVTLFLAEMGDKTQFAAFAASAQTSKTWVILVAGILAVSLSVSLGVIAGKYVGEAFSPALIKYLSGGLFIAIGLWILWSK